MIDVEENFNKRFRNLELSKEEDKSLFEDYINFLATYKFDKCNYNSFWKETFVPLNLEEKEKLIKVDYNCIKFELCEKGKKLRILDDNNDSYIIDADKYCLVNFIYDSKYETEIKNL